MTEEQAEVARLLCQGLTKRAIALRLGIPLSTVEGRLRRAYRAAGAQCQIELGMWCVAHGVVTMSELQEVYGYRGKVGQGSVGQPEGAPLTGQISC